MNRGSLDICIRCGRRSAASMRPRFMNRGSFVLAFRDLIPDILASMRPRFMNRGSETMPPVRRSARTGFNEAPIHESGKWPI